MENLTEQDHNSSDSSTSEIEAYVPTKDTPNTENLDVDDSVYAILEYISLDWPSQTLAVKENMLSVATNPDLSVNKPNLIDFNFEDTRGYTDMGRFTHERRVVEHSFNRMKYNKENLVCMSDDFLVVYDKERSILTEDKDRFAYGLNCTDGKIYAGCMRGDIKIIEDLDYYSNTEDINDSPGYYHGSKIRLINCDGVESISVNGSVLFAGCLGGSLRGVDLRTRKEVFQLSYKRDVNAVDSISSQKIVYGDDDGVLRICDVRYLENVETINWHKSAVNFVKWTGEDEFVSCSDEQVVLWDTSFAEECKYHKYLKFVHQGQKAYKEVDYSDETYFVTSIDGICIFKLAFDKEHFNERL